MKSLYKIIVSVSIFFQFTTAKTQSYHVYNGSSYAGIFSLYTNPASLVNAPYKWDVNVLSTQTTIINRAFDISGLFSITDTLKYNFTNGTMPRAVHNIFDLNLLNARYKINETTALAFGLRGRLYSHIKTTNVNYADSVSNINSFLHINKDVGPVSGIAASSGWLQFDLALSKIIKKDEHQIIAAGITLGYMKNLSGISSQLTQFSFQETSLPGNQYYQTLTGANLSSYYSQNYDNYDSTKDGLSNIKAFVKDTKSSLNISIGFEILLKKRMPYDDEAINSSNYDWKIGVSIMDIGKSIYQPNGRAYANPVLKTGQTNYTLQNKFNSIHTLQGFTDSLITLFSRYDTVKNNFNINAPTRLTISVDRNLGHHFFINASGNVNFYAVNPYTRANTRELSVLTLTPRWEKKNIGIYLPVSYYAEKNIWVGCGFKFGPLIFGLHNVGWLLGKADQLRGGGYIGIHIKPKDKVEKSRYDCY